MVPRSSADPLDETRGCRRRRRRSCPRVTEPANRSTTCRCAVALDIADGVGCAGSDSADLGELGHGEVGMEGKFDSLEQLFPGVHASSTLMPRSVDRHSRVGAATMGRWNLSTACTEPRVGCASRPTRCRGSPRAPVGRAVSTPTRRTRPSPITIDVDRAGLSTVVRDRVMAAAGPIDHGFVGGFPVAVPQSSDRVGRRVGAPRRGRKASATAASADSPIGLCRPQATGVEATCSPSASRRRRRPSTDE